MINEERVEQSIEDYKENHKNWKEEIKTKQVEYLQKVAFEGEDTKYLFNIYDQSRYSVFLVVIVNGKIDKATFVCNLKEETMIENVVNRSSMDVLMEMYHEFIIKQPDWEKTPIIA